MTDTDRRLLALQRSIDELYDHNVRQRRMLADLLYNLDEENMPAVKALIERYRSENGESVAALKVTAEENYAAIESLAAVQTEQGESIASVEQTANSLGAQVVIAVERSESAESAAASAESAAGEANANVSNGAYIIARVNEDGSLIRIKADKLELSGYVTLEGLSAPGETEIDGANIKTGTISADRIAVNENGQINFDKLGSLGFITESGASGEIRLNENENGLGEISVKADGSVALDGGGASVMLIDDGNGNTEASIYANRLRMNGLGGVTGEYSLGGGSMILENGIVVAVTEGSGGGTGGDTVTLEAPDVELNGEYASYTISNPNGKGTICYQTYWYDNYGNSWDSEVYYDDSSSVSGDISEFPESGGYIGVRAWIECNGYSSSESSAESEYA